MVATVAPRLRFHASLGVALLALAAADPASRRAALEKMLAGAIDTAAANEDVEPAQALVAELTRRLHRGAGAAAMPTAPTTPQLSTAPATTPPRTPRTLSAFRKQSTSRWISQLDGARSLLVQVGAFTHGGGSYDPGIKCIQSGWRAMLVEPMPDSFGALQRRYGNVSDRVKLVNAAVCDNCTDHQDLWFVDLTNATGNWGSMDADARCAAHTVSGLREIASLNARHLTKQQYMYKSNAQRCAKCSALLGKKLPKTCMRKVIYKNLRSRPIACSCLREEVPALPAYRDLGAVALLLVDAEGHDKEVLSSFPFGAVPVWRVVFEGYHMNRPKYEALTALLHAHGFERVSGGYRAFQVVFHHANSSEAMAPGATRE